MECRVAAEFTSVQLQGKVLGHEWRARAGASTGRRPGCVDGQGQSGPGCAHWHMRARRGHEARNRTPERSRAARGGVSGPEATQPGRTNGRGGRAAHRGLAGIRQWRVDAQSIADPSTRNQQELRWATAGLEGAMHLAAARDAPSAGCLRAPGRAMPAARPRIVGRAAPPLSPAAPNSCLWLQPAPTPKRFVGARVRPRRARRPHAGAGRRRGSVGPQRPQDSFGHPKRSAVCLVMVDHACAGSRIERRDDTQQTLPPSTHSWGRGSQLKALFAHARAPHAARSAPERPCGPQGPSHRPPPGPVHQAPPGHGPPATPPARRARPAGGPQRAPGAARSDRIRRGPWPSWR